MFRRVVIETTSHRYVEREKQRWRCLVKGNYDEYWNFILFPLCCVGLDISAYRGKFSLQGNLLYLQF